MKITISCSGGVSRSLNLANSLERMGLLYRLFVPYYSHKHFLLTRVFGVEEDRQVVDSQKVRTNIKLATLRRFIAKTRLDKLLGFNSFYLLGEMIDKSVARQLESGSDIVIAESNMALRTLKKAKELGAIAVLDRTNSHIEYQSELLDEEFERLGIKTVYNRPEVIEKGVKEYREADYICVLSSFVKKTFLKKNVPENKLLLVPSGVELKDFKQIDKEDNIFRVIFCGGICVKKGVHYLLEAYRSLNLKNSELWLIGRTFKDIEPTLKRYEALFKIIDFVSHDQLYRYFCQGSVFVLPSLEEGLAKVILEAMACGLPVIATTNSGAGDVVRDGMDGYIVPIRDVEALKEKMLFLFENPDVCRQMGQNAKSRVGEGFTWEDYAHRVVEAFEKMLQNHDWSTRRLKLMTKNGG